MSQASTEVRGQILLLGILAVSCVVGIIAMVYAGRPISYHRNIETVMAGWAASPYAVALLVVTSLDAIGVAAVAGVLSLSIGPILIFGAQRWFGIDTRYNPIFMATPFLQVACFLPFGLLAHRKKEASPAPPNRR
jgi:hypothetical protein